MEIINCVFKFSMEKNKKNCLDLDDIKSMIKGISESYSFSTDDSNPTRRKRKNIQGRMKGGLTKAEHAFNCIKQIGPQTTEEVAKYFDKNKILCDVSASLSNAKSFNWLTQKKRGGVWELSEEGKKMPKFQPQDK